MSSGAVPGRTSGVATDGEESLAWPVVKHRRAADLVSFAVQQLVESRLLRAGMLQMAEGKGGRRRRAARKIFVAIDGEVAARSDWLLDPAALGRAGIKKLLKGWHDAAALAAVEPRQLGRYDLVRHPAAIMKVDCAQTELAKRFPDVHELLRQTCDAAELPRLLYADLPPGTRRDAAGLAVRAKSGAPSTEFLHPANDPVAERITPPQAGDA